MHELLKPHIFHYWKWLSVFNDHVYQGLISHLLFGIYSIRMVYFSNMYHDFDIENHDYYFGTLAADRLCLLMNSSFMPKHWWAIIAVQVLSGTSTSPELHENAIRIRMCIIIVSIQNDNHKIPINTVLVVTIWKYSHLLAGSILEKNQIIRKGEQKKDKL